MIRLLTSARSQIATLEDQIRYLRTKAEAYDVLASAVQLGMRRESYGEAQAQSSLGWRLEEAILELGAQHEREQEASARPAAEDPAQCGGPATQATDA